MKEIMERRSIRKYQQQPIPEEMIERLLRAAMRAPSAQNQQPWEFIVIRQRQTLLRISELHPYAKMLPGADCAIMVCGNTKRFQSQYDYWVQDCAAATQNILLEAVYLGLGAVWLGVYPVPERVQELREVAHLPAEVIPFCLVSLGYPADQKQPLDTYLPERIHRESW